MTRPPALAGDVTTRVLGAIVDEHAETGRATYRGIADRVGIAPTTARRHTLRLVDLGLIDGTDASGGGGLHPLVYVVARG